MFKLTVAAARGERDPGDVEIALRLVLAMERSKRRARRQVAILEHHNLKRRASQDEEAPTDERSGLGLPNHLVPLCVWDSGVNGSVLGKA